MRVRIRTLVPVLLLLSALVLLYTFRDLSRIQDLASRLLAQDPDPNARPKHFPTSVSSPAINPSFENKTATLVVGRLRSEKIDWIHRDLPQLQTAIYTVDDPQARLKPPKNKGREAMVYLTFIIDNYDSLPDASIFIHSHSDTWHNAELLGRATANMVKRFSYYRLTREGYVNLRCEWFPGCPSRQHLVNPSNFTEGEGGFFVSSWNEIFPNDTMPEVLAAPCCAQFAASKQQIRSVPLDRWNHYRNWLLNTEQDDWVAGLLFEYMWQYIFTGKAVLCVDVHACYCDGFGVCFGSKENFTKWMSRRERKDQLVAKWDKLRETGGEDSELEKKMGAEDEALRVDLEEATRRGDEFENREKEVGRR